MPPCSRQRGYAARGSKNRATATLGGADRVMAMDVENTITFIWIWKKCIWKHEKNKSSVWESNENIILNL